MIPQEQLFAAVLACAGGAGFLLLTHPALICRFSRHRYPGPQELGKIRVTAALFLTIIVVGCLWAVAAASARW